MIERETSERGQLGNTDTSRAASALEQPPQVRLIKRIALHPSL